MTTRLRTLEWTSAPSSDDVYALCSCGAMLFGFDEARAHLATSASILTEQSFGSPAVRYLVSDHMIRVVAPDDDDPGLPALHLLTGWNPDGSNEHEEVA